MSIKHALLGLLDTGPRGAGALRREFDSATGGRWPLNQGQVAQTLDRAVRDGLVEQAGQGQASGREVVEYALTDLGHREIEQWYARPVPRDKAERDEFAIKLAVAIAASEGGLSRSHAPDVDAVLHVQRRGTMVTLQSMTAELRRPGVRSSPEGLLMQRELFAVEAELRWLDHVESALWRR